MTKNQLEKGQQIQEDLAMLKTALSEVNRVRFFTTDEGCCRRSGDPFLSELHTKVQSLVVNEVNAKIAELQKEFDSM